MTSHVVAAAAAALVLFGPVVTNGFMAPTCTQRTQIAHSVRSHRGSVNMLFPRNPWQSRPLLVGKGLVASVASDATVASSPDAPAVAPVAMAPKGTQDAEVPTGTYGESPARSFAKALIWRLTAAIVTLVSGLVFAKSLATAMSIVGSDFVSKSGFMFVGERAWNRVKWGTGQKGDSSQRSLAKALLWRVFAAANTLLCSNVLAGDFSVAAKIAGTDTIVKTLLFFFNERIWYRINWGKEYDIEYNI